MIYNWQSSVPHNLFLVYLSQKFNLSDFFKNLLFFFVAGRRMGHISCTRSMYFFMQFT